MLDYMNRSLLTVILIVLFLTATAHAGPAEVVDASAVRTSDGTYRFTVTVRHADTGWDHYANRWQVLGEDGTVYGTRVLLHPHTDEQPFTRSLSGVKLPAGTKRVLVRAGDSVHGDSGTLFPLDLPAD